MRPKRGGGLNQKGTAMSETSTTTAVPQGRRADGTPIRLRKPQPLTLARFGDCVLVGRGYDSAILSRRRITALLNRAIVLGEVEVGGCGAPLAITTVRAWAVSSGARIRR